MSSAGEYASYIVSPEWRDKLPTWLKLADHRCSLFPWMIVGKKVSVGKGKRVYKPYAAHHMHYENQGAELYGRDVIILSKFAHKYIIHGICSGFKSAGKQKTPYPNLAQRMLHGWCVQATVIKLQYLMLWKFLLSVSVIGFGVAIARHFFFISTIS